MLTRRAQANALLWDIAVTARDAYRRRELVFGVVQRPHHGDDLPTQV